MIYLASPYSHEDPTVRQQRFEAVKHCQGRLLQEGIPCISPIVMFHNIAEDFKLPKDEEYWRSINSRLLKACSAVAVLSIEGWEDSVGLKEELHAARLGGYAVVFVSSSPTENEFRTLEEIA